MPLEIRAVEHRDEDFGLSSDEISMLWAMEEKHFWHRARNEWIARALEVAEVKPPAKLLEVGCGSGAVAGFLHARGYDVTGIDTNAPLVKKAFARCPQASFVIGDLNDLDRSGFDTVGFFDVLEHLDHPEELLDAGMARLRPSGVVIATVPAQASLHTVIDDLSGHKRRYEVGELAALFSRAGLLDVEERGIFRATVPAQRLARRKAIMDGRPLEAAERAALWRNNFAIPAAPINLAFGALCALERHLAFGRSVDRPGASLLCVGRLGAPSATG